MVTNFRGFLSCLLAAVLLSGCSWGYLGTIQEAYRVDPVVVQWEKARVNNRDCRISPTAPTRTVSTQDSSQTGQQADRVAKLDTDVFCPIDLDTWEFPHDRLRREQEGIAESKRIPAYAKLSLCYEQYVEPGSLSEVKQTIELLGKQKAEVEARVKSLDDELATLRITEADAKKTIDAVTEKSKAKIETKKSSRTSLKTIDLILLENNIAYYKDIEGALRNAQAKPQPKAPVSLTPFPAPTDSIVCRAMRNLFQDEILARSEAMCRKHVSDIAATSAVVSTNLGFITLLGSTLGAIVTGDVLQRSFSGVASVSSGTQNLVGREVYRDYVVPAISKAIIDERRRRFVEIRVEQGKGLSEYTIAHALRDAIDYHESCSFSNGLLLLTTAAEKRVLTTPDALRKQIDDLYDQLKKLEDSSKPADGRNISSDELERLQKMRLRLRQQIDGLLERLRMVQSIQ